MDEAQSEVYGRAGHRRRRVASALLGLVASALLGVALASAAAVVLGGATAGAGAASSGREPLRGHQGLVPPGATLIGPAPAATALPLDVTLEPRDPAALAAEVQAVSDPTSPQYRHFLTPAQFAQRFGPTPATIAQVASALRREGLTVGTPAATGLSLPVSGTVTQVQSAFATPISKYRLSSGKTGYDNTSAPEVPTSVAPQIEGILGLDTLSPPQPSTSVPEATQAVTHAESLLATPALAPGQPTPTGTSCSNSIGKVQSGTGALDAPQLAQAYSFDPLYSSGDYGAGSTIALLEMSGAGYLSSDITTFAKCYGFTPGNGQVSEVPVGGGGATGPGTAEAELDIDTVLSMAPKANIEVYEGGASDSLYDVFSRIVSDDTAKIVSASWTNGCEAYVGQSVQSSENTLFQAAAAEGQSIFVATGDQGSESCNINGEIAAATASDPVAQAVDPSTGTLYIANKSSNSVSVDSEGSTSDRANFATEGSVTTGTGPDAVALASSLGKVFIANSGSTLTVVSTATCNQSTTSGCSSPTQVASGGHLSSPSALAVNGSTLYVGNTNGSVAVYNASGASPTWVATVTLSSGSVPTALAVDPTNGFVYVADGTNNRVEYFSATTCNATTTSGCSTTPTTVTVGKDPVALVVASGPGDLYVANAGSGGGISVVSLSTHAVVTTISTTLPSNGANGTGVVESIGLSPDTNEVLAVLKGLGFPGDVMATINTSSQTITATVNLETGTDSMGQLVSDGTLDYVWVTDETNGGDVIQNLNTAVSDPASQPYVTAVGGTSFGHGTATLGPPPAEQVWNDQLYYSEGAGGGGISQTFAMPGYQQALGTVTGSTGTPCATSSGDCREIPDVSADADPSTGYIVYDSVNLGGWNALGGTSGASPLWAAVLAVVASADGNTAGYGELNPALYLLAQRSPGTYLNDVTSGNNDYNATDGGQYPAMAGYDMATGLGTPVASALATGLTAIPLTVVVSGSQPYGGAPTFTASANYAGSGTAPFGVTLDTSGLSCTTVGSSTAISPSMALGQYTLQASSCTGLTFSGADGADYSVVYTSAANDFTVTPGPLDVAVSGGQTYGGTPSFSGTDTPPPGITVSTAGLSCTQAGTSTIASTMPAGSYAVVASSCGGATLSGTNASDYAVVYTSAAGDFAVTKAPLTVTASSTSMTYGGTVPTITAAYSGFVNGDTSSSLSTEPNCSTMATSASPVLGSPYATSCGGAVDPNYNFSYFGGSVTVDTATLTITAGSPTMTYGATLPTITALYSGFKNGDTASSLSTSPTCSSTATSSSTVAGSPYQTVCNGAADSNYAIGYVAGALTVSKAPLTVTASGGPMTYGGSVPTITPGYSGFVNGDMPSSLTTQPTCSTTATSSSPVAGSPYSSTCSGAADPNYTIVPVNGSVTVAKAPLTITASGGPMTYGGSVPTITPGYSGFVNNDTVTSLTTQPTCSTLATSSTPVSGSPYTSSCSGAVDSNYAITYVGGSVTVAAAPLTITASSTSMTYGGAVPTIAPGYSGFVNGDSSSSLTTKPTCSTVATSSSPVSTIPYTSSCGGAVDLNYTISYFGGSVMVNTATLTITASSVSMPYGGTVPTITPIFSGFVNGDTSSSLTTPPTCSTSATSSSPPSPPTYPSSCSGAADPNYTIVPVNGSVTVTTPISVAVSGSQTYGGTPSFSGAASPPEGITVNTAALSCTEVGTSTVVGPALAVGSDTLVPSSCDGATFSGANAADYAAAYTSAPGDFTVNQAALTITASSTSMTYGSPVPAITPLYAGFKNGDSSSSLSAPPTCSTEATSTSPPTPSPTYSSSCSGAVDPNYSIAYVGGFTTVTPAPVPVAVSGSQPYQGSPSFTGTDTPPAGVTVDTAGMTCGMVAPSTPISTTLTSGDYTLVAGSCQGAVLSGPNAPDYAVIYTSAAGDFTVTGGPVTPAPTPARDGYWLVGSDGGIFTFGSAQFHGSTGSLTLQRPVVGISPTASKGGYWLVASDGGIFAFGDAGFYGSIPGVGLSPAGSGLPHSLNAPIVGMVPSADGAGYFMVASDGGVFAFGDARFAGSCPGIGGCSGAAVAVVPDADGNGYWLVTQTGNVYAFGDAPFYGAPGAQGSPVTSAVRTSDGHGYWVLLADGAVYAYGDAVARGGPVGAVGGFDPASAIFSDADGGGYWVASAQGAVFTYGDAPDDGSMAGTHLNGSIIAATGF